MVVKSNLPRVIWKQFLQPVQIRMLFLLKFWQPTTPFWTHTTPSTANWLNLLMCMAGKPCEPPAHVLFLYCMCSYKQWGKVQESKTKTTHPFPQMQGRMEQGLLKLQLRLTSPHCSPGTDMYPEWGNNTLQWQEGMVKLWLVCYTDTLLLFPLPKPFLFFKVNYKTLSVRKVDYIHFIAIY